MFHILICGQTSCRTKFSCSWVPIRRPRPMRGSARPLLMTPRTRHKVSISGSHTRSVWLTRIASFFHIGSECLETCDHRATLPNTRTPGITVSLSNRSSCSPSWLDRRLWELVHPVHYCPRIRNTGVPLHGSRSNRSEMQLDWRIHYCYNILHEDCHRTWFKICFIGWIQSKYADLAQRLSDCCSYYRWWNAQSKPVELALSFFDYS